MSGRVVIAGGSGLIGTALVAELAGSGREVVVLSRRPQGVRGLPAGARAEGWNGREAGPWGASVDGAEAVVNLAGENLAEGRWTPARKSVLVSSRVEPARAIAEAVAAARVRPGVLVQASGVGFYGSQGDRVLDEDAAAGRGFVPELCQAWEGASAAVSALGVRRVLLRTGVVLAREGGALAKMLPPFRWGVGGPFGNGRQWWPWIHLDDAVAGIRFLIEHREAAGPFNLTAPGLLRNREFARALGRALHRPSWLPAPAWGLRLALGEMASVLLDSQRAPPLGLIRAGMRFGFADAAAALGDLI